jgi:mono/diheme cytochrome c family protein
MIRSATTQAASLLGAAVLVIGMAMAQSRDSTQAKFNQSVYAELSKVPAKAAVRENPLESDSESVAAGAKLFRLHCAECHGSGADGGKKGPSLRAEEVQRATPGTLFWLLTNGVVRKGMPVWSRLPEPERGQLVSYVKSLGAPARPPSP